MYHDGHTQSLDQFECRSPQFLLLLQVSSFDVVTEQIQSVSQTAPIQHLSMPFLDALIRPSPFLPDFLPPGIELPDPLADEHRYVLPSNLKERFGSIRREGSAGPRCEDARFSAVLAGPSAQPLQVQFPKDFATSRQ